MRKEGIGEQRATDALTVRDERFSMLQDQAEQLLPGLTNAIVLEQIVPKLPWKAFHILSSVSPSWQQAIRSHQVYDARVRSHLTETLVVLNHTVPRGIHALSLYSMREKSWHLLPPFPYYDRGIPYSCQCISLDGKIYLLGGQRFDDRDFDDRDRYLSRDRSEVYVLDVAAQREWRQCANMPEVRSEFGCGVADGKIFVFGGMDSFDKPIRASVMYDPKEDAWSSVMPMKSMRFVHHVTAVGEELFVHGGLFYEPGYDLFGCNASRADEASSDRVRQDQIREAFFLEVYHPGKDQWRLVKPFEPEAFGAGTLFAARGKLHSMTPFGICVHDVESDENSWTDQRSFVFADIDPADFLEFDMGGIQPVGDELLALVNWEPGKMGKGHPPTLIESKGFGTKNERILWETVDCELSFERLFSPPFMCPIEL